MAAPPAPRPALALPLLSLALLAALVWGLRRGCSVNTDQIADPDAEAWQAALATGQLPPVREYLERFPQGAYASQARLREEALQDSVKVYLKDALLFDPGDTDACPFLLQALRIDPDNADARR